MQNFTADALVLRVREQGANDKLLTLISAEGGRFYALLKGGHSIRHREAAATEPYTWSNFEFYEKNGFRWVKSAHTAESFAGIRYDVEKLFLAAYFADVVHELSDEGAPAGEILSLCLNALYLLAATKGEDARIKAAFELRAAAIAGFTPALSHCARCGKPTEGDAYLDVMNGALLCEACLGTHTPLLPLTEADALGTRHILCPLTGSAAAAVRFVMTAEPKRVFAFRLTDERSLDLFSRAGEAYLLHHLERSFDTLENYRRMCSFGRPTAKK